MRDPKHDWRPFGTNRLVSEPYKGYYHFRRYRCSECDAILIDQRGGGSIVAPEMRCATEVVLSGPDRETIAKEFHRASRDFIAKQAQALADAMSPDPDLVATQSPFGFIEI